MLELKGLGGSGMASRVRAYKSSAAQSIPVSTWTKVVLDVEDWDNLGEFASDRFTAKQAGHYAVIGNNFFVAMSNGGYIVTAIYKNGVIASARRLIAGGDGDCKLGASDILYLAVGEYFELFAFHDNVGGKDVATGSAYTFFAVHRES